jgi:two-component system chemotaxis response regulator CheY
VKILLIDDSRAIVAMVGAMIKEIGHEFESAEDGQKAVDFFTAGGKVDLVLLDWNMPNMNGLEFLQKNQTDKLTGSPIVMMTTENKPEKIQMALLTGASEYIMKPFTSDVLADKIAQVLEDF